MIRQTLSWPYRRVRLALVDWALRQRGLVHVEAPLIGVSPGGSVWAYWDSEKQVYVIIQASHNLGECDDRP